jgi:hypothetical protein
MSSLNSKKPWSPSDERRLRAGLRAGTTILHVAVLLRRDVQEVQMKLAQLAAQHNSFLEARRRVS